MITEELRRVHVHHIRRVSIDVSLRR